MMCMYMYTIEMSCLFFYFFVHTWKHLFNSCHALTYNWLVVGKIHGENIQLNLCKETHWEQDFCPYIRRLSLSRRFQLNSAVLPLLTCIMLSSSNIIQRNIVSYCLAIRIKFWRRTHPWQFIVVLFIGCHLYIYIEHLWWSRFAFYAYTISMDHKCSYVSGQDETIVRFSERGWTY